MIYKNKKVKKMRDRLQKLAHGDDILSKDITRLSTGASVERSSTASVGKLVRADKLNNRYDVVNKILKRIEKILAGKRD